jgi:hypothetical protein
LWTEELKNTSKADTQLNLHALLLQPKGDYFTPDITHGGIVLSLRSRIACRSSAHSKKFVTKKEARRYFAFTAGRKKKVNDLQCIIERSLHFTLTY